MEELGILGFRSIGQSVHIVSMRAIGVEGHGVDVNWRKPYCC